MKEQKLQNIKHSQREVSTSGDSESSNLKRQMKEIHSVGEMQLAKAHSQPFIVWRNNSKRDYVFAVTLDEAQRFVVARVFLNESIESRHPSSLVSIVPLTFEVVLNLIQLLLFSERWRESISSHKHTKLVDSIKQKLHHLLLFWQRHNFHQGWLSEIF